MLPELSDDEETFDVDVNGFPLDFDFQSDFQLDLGNMEENKITVGSSLPSDVAFESDEKLITMLKSFSLFSKVNNPDKNNFSVEFTVFENDNDNDKIAIIKAEITVNDNMIVNIIDNIIISFYFKEIVNSIYFTDEDHEEMINSKTNYINEKYGHLNFITDIISVEYTNGEMRYCVLDI